MGFRVEMGLLLGDGFSFGDGIMIHGRERIMDEEMGFRVWGFD